METNTENETNLSAEQRAAMKIDSIFQSLANAVPKRLLKAIAGESTTLYEREDVGKIEATFIGKVAVNEELKSNFAIRVKAQPAGHDGMLDFWKEYEIDYFGKLIDTKPTTVEELADSPVELDELVSVFKGMHDAYLQPAVRVGESADAKVIPIDIYRAA